MGVKMKRILHVIDSLGRGGAESLVVSVVTSLPQFEHHIVTFSSENAFREKLEKYKHIKLYRLPDFRVLNLPVQVLRLNSLIKKISPSIVHSQLFWSNMIARLATPSSIPLYFTNQSIQKHEAFSKKWQVLIEKLTYKKRHTLISVSETVEKEYQDFIGIKGKHYILYNIADDVYFKEPRRKFDISEIRCVNVGRLHPQKNQKFLLKVFTHLPSRISLDIYGKGPLENDLRLLKEKNKINNVNFKGLSNDISDLLQEYDVFLMSSLYEGFSLALMEAMASGLPVIIPDTQLFREMGGAAALYFDLNDEKALVKILEFITEDQLISMSAKSFEQANRMAKKENHLKQLLDIYDLN
jgi:glycosyltransferase involved in cell wall biosynthesis